MKNVFEGKRVILYMRVSTDIQARRGESMEDQEQALTQWAQENKCTIVGSYADAGFSGHKSFKTRPGLKKLLQDVKEKKTDLIAFTKLDRWGRKSSDYYKLQDILEANNVSWVAILEDYNTATSDGRFKVGIMLSVNQHEAERTADRINFTIEQKKKRGEIYCGRVPLGYTVKDKKPVIDDETKEAVQAFWKFYTLGYGMGRAISEAYARGVNINVPAASYMLRNAVNYTGNIQGIECEPYLTAEEAEKIMGSRRKLVRKSKQTYYFTGLIRCGQCNHQMSVHNILHHKKDGSPCEYVNYNCQLRYNSNRNGCQNDYNVNENKLEKYLIDTFEKQIDIVISKYEAEEEQHKTEKEAIETEIRRLQAKRERCINAYMAEAITLDELKSNKEDIDNKIGILKSRIPKVERSPNTIRKQLPDGWQNIYYDLSRDRKKEFWSKVLEDITVYPDKHIEYTFKY